MPNVTAVKVEANLPILLNYKQKDIIKNLHCKTKLRRKKWNEKKDRFMSFQNPE